MVHKEKHVGDVNKIKFCGQSVFMTASSSGSVSLHQIASSDDAAVRTQKTWDKIHSGGGGGGRSEHWKINLILIYRVNHQVREELLLTYELRFSISAGRPMSS